MKPVHPDNAWGQISNRRITFWSDKYKTFTSYPLANNKRSLEDCMKLSHGSFFLVDVLNNQWKDAGNPETGEYLVICIQAYVDNFYEERARDVDDEYSEGPSFRDALMSGISIHEVSAQKLESLIDAYKSPNFQSIESRGNLSFVHMGITSDQEASDFEYEQVYLSGDRVLALGSIKVHPILNVKGEVASLGREPVSSDVGKTSFKLLFPMILQKADLLDKYGDFAPGNATKTVPAGFGVKDMFKDFADSEGYSYDPRLPKSSGPLSAPPVEEPPRPGTLAGKTGNWAPAPVRADPIEVEKPSKSDTGFTIDDMYVRAEVTIKSDLWETVAVLYEDVNNEFNLGYLFQPNTRRVGVSVIKPIVFYALLEAAKKSNNFTRVGPVWIRNDMMDDFEYLPAGMISLGGLRIEPRPWNSSERVGAPMPGSKRMRSQGKQ